MKTATCFLLYIILLSVFLISGCKQNEIPGNAEKTGRLPQIYPDYSELTIPPNIAPLNFVIREKGENYIVRITPETGKPLIISNKNPEIRINLNTWKKLLAENRGKTLKTEVYVLENGRWKLYETIKQQVSEDEIDSYISYRLINSAYVMWFEMGIYQRNLQNFEEDVIIQNKSIGGGCVNCHSLSKNNPEKFMFHIRARFPGTVIYNNGILQKVETKTDYTLASAAYGNWHPDGRHIAFSVNKINQNFHVFKDQSNEVTDKYSDLVVYDTETKMLTTSPAVSTRSRENLPEWSADGKTLFYITASEAINDSARAITRYSLMKIPYDVNTKIWGQPDTMISANQLGKSITFPKASPDGRFIAFCLTDYGYFTIHHKNSDIYLFDLEKQKIIVPEELNSAETESYHSWSSNGRWLIFSSRRMDGVHTRTFISHIDKTGKAGKPFVLPQEDPEFYTDYLLNFNRPEMMTGKIKVSPQKIRDAAREAASPVLFDPDVKIDALSGASKIKAGKNQK